MRSFSEFIQLKEQTEPTVSGAAASSLSPSADLSPPAPQIKTKWKASKKEILTYWNTLRGDTPIRMKPIEYKHTGSTYGEDGIRINGSPIFIASVLGRLKDILNYESPVTKLTVSYRQAESNKDTKNSYVFYISARERGRKSKKTSI